MSPVSQADPGSWHLIYRPLGARALRTACGRLVGTVSRVTPDRADVSCADCRRTAATWLAGSEDAGWALEGHTWEREAYP